MYIDIILYYLLISVIVGMYCSIKAHSYIIYDKIFPDNKTKTIIWTILGGFAGGLTWPITLMYLSDRWKYNEPFNPFKVEERDESNYLFW